MRKKLYIRVLLATAICCTSLAAMACRPFGSYQFAEDKDGGIWFTEGDNNAVSRLSPDGTVISYPLPTANAEPSSLAIDRDGNLWFAETEGRNVGRLGTDGRIVEFPTVGGHPSHVTLDDHGVAWFTQVADHKGKAGDTAGEHADHASVSGIGRVDRQGAIHFYPLAKGWPTSVVIDSRSQTWVSILIPGAKDEKPKGRIARLSNDGEWQIESAWDNSCPRNLLTDRTGKLHYTDSCRSLVGYRTSGGKWVERKLPAGTNIQQTSLAKDGTLWFTDRQHLGKIDKTGKVSHVERPDNGDQIFAVLATRRGDIVFSEAYNYNINRLKKSGEFVEHLVGIDERRGSREVKDGEVCYVKFGARIAAKAEMDRQRTEEVKSRRFKPDGIGTEKLVEKKCLVCHDSRRLLLSRRSDWTPSLTRMHAYRSQRNVEPLTVDETKVLVRYFNEYYGLNR